MLGHDVLRRPRALRVPERGVRTLLALERPAAGSLSERDALRGGDPGDGARPLPRGGGRPGARRTARRVGDLGRDREHPDGAARLPGARPADARDRPAADRDAGDRAPGLRQGGAPVRHRRGPRADRPRDHAGGSGRGAPRDHGPDRRARRVRGQLPLWNHRPHRGALGARRRAGRRAPRRRLPRGVPAAVRGGDRAPPPALRFPPARGDDDLRRHAQVRLRPEGHVDAALQERGPAPLAVLPRAGLAGGEVRLARDRGEPLGGAARGDLGLDGVPRARGVRAPRPRDLRHRGEDGGLGAPLPGAPDPRRAHLLLRVHLGAVRRVPRERRAPGAGGSA